MKIHRFFTDYSVNGDSITITNSEIVSQIYNVLKLKQGEQIAAVNGSLEKTVQLTKVSEDAVSGFVLNEKKLQDEALRKVRLFCSILKKENFELAAQKATEAGVAEIIPIIANRTVKLGINPQRIEKIIRESAEQCGRISCPVLHKAVTIDEAFELANEDSADNVLFDPSGADFKNHKFLTRVNIFIGPEGGWTKEELELAQKKQLKIVNLGSNILRAETAAIICSFVAANF